MTIPARLLAFDEIRAAAQVAERAAAVAVKAEQVFHGAEARGVPAALPAFDEEAAAARLARAKAADAVHDTDETEKVTAAIERERVEHARRQAQSEAAAGEARAQLVAARQAHEAAQSVAAGARNDLFTAMVNRAGELLPELTAAALDQAKALADLTADITAIVAATNPGYPLSRPYLEVALQGVPLDAEAVRARGGRIGSTRSTTALVFDA